jgi:hypothetical protein
MAQDETSPKKSRKASKPPSEPPVLADEPKGASDINQLKVISADEVVRSTTLPKEMRTAQTAMRRALAICSDLPPTADQLADDRDLPKLRQKWRVALEDIRGDFRFERHKHDFNEAMIGTAGVYWSERWRRQQVDLGTGARAQIDDLIKTTKRLLLLLGDPRDPQLQNYLHLADRPMTPSEFKERASRSDLDGPLSRLWTDAATAQMATPATFRGSHNHRSIVAAVDGANVKRGTVELVQRALLELEELAIIAGNIPTTKPPKGHHTAVRFAANQLAPFWSKLGRSTSMTSTGEASPFADFVARCACLSP